MITVLPQLEAKLERAHWLFDQSVALAARLRDTKWNRDDSAEVRAIQVAIDAYRVAAERLAPIEYGPRQSGQVVVPIQINTSLDLTVGKPTTASANPYTITVEKQQ